MIKINGQWCKDGAELKVGDVLSVMGRQRTITHFETHPGLNAWGKFWTARVACSGDWGVTCFDEDPVQVVPLAHEIPE